MVCKCDFKDAAGNLASVSVLITCFWLSSFLFIFTSSSCYFFFLLLIFLFTFALVLGRIVYLELFVFWITRKPLNDHSPLPHLYFVSVKYTEDILNSWGRFLEVVTIPYSIWTSWSIQHGVIWALGTCLLNECLKERRIRPIIRVYILLIKEKVQEWQF